jgi:hypothetical protein
MSDQGLPPPKTWLHMPVLGALPTRPPDHQPSGEPEACGVPGVALGRGTGGRFGELGTATRGMPGVAPGRGAGGRFGELGTDGSMTILLDAGAELAGDVRGTGIDWLLDFGDLPPEISAAMSELTRMAKITPAMRSADGLTRLRCRPAEVRNSVIPQRLAATGGGLSAGP